MVRLNIKNHNLTHLEGYLNNHTVTKCENKYESILDNPSI